MSLKEAFALPSTGDYAPYFQTYINAAIEGGVDKLMAEGPDAWEALFRAGGPGFAAYRYAEGKWSVAEVLQHVTDSERIFATRMLIFARGDEGPHRGYDQDLYAAASAASVAARSTASLIGEFRAVRAATQALFESISPEEAARGGIADGKPFTVSAAVYVIAGHEMHHRRVVRERYLS